MFRSLANYLLGTNSDEATNGVEQNLRLTNVSDDDWVLVDRDSEGNSDVESEESLNDAEEGARVYSNVLTRSSSTSSLPYSNMEESWFLTPPPCFTSAGPIYMETSPLENLLIEHPSMSVYHSQPVLIARRHNLPVPVQPTVPVEIIREDIVVVNHDEVEEVQRVAQAPRRNHVETLRQQERQSLKNKQAQKVKL